ncbi:MAG: DUF4465 domain-containing protein [Bacteroidota bacterium]
MKNRIYTKISVLATAFLLGVGANAQTVSTFESVELGGANNVKIPSNGSVVGQFTSGSCNFKSVYQIGFGGYWSAGWAYSKVNDTTTQSFDNLYSSYANKGYNNSPAYVVGQNNTVLSLSTAAQNTTLKGLYVSNATFAALSMKTGDAFAKKFGGTTGNDTDWFKLEIKGYSSGTLKSQAVDFYLADFRSSNNANDYIIKDWTWVDLSGLGNVDSLMFELSSSDAGQFGMNTPAFFAIDEIISQTDTATFENLTFPFGQNYWNRGSKVFTEVYTDGNANFVSAYTVSPSYNYWSKGFAISNYTDSVTEGLDNIYASANGKGSNGSAKYAIANNNSIIKLTSTAIGKRVSGLYVNNGTYAYYSMLKGDAFAKKFGGATGNDQDWFRLNIKAWHNGTKLNDSVLFYLADFRFTDNSQDYILKNWGWVNLTSFGNVDSLQFTLESSDVGQFGMNTPAYFAIDDFTTLNSGVGVADINKLKSLTVYPNPSASYIQLMADEKIETVNIYNVQGQEVLTTTGNSVDVSLLEQGVYMVSATTSNGTIKSKFIKE